MRLLTVAFMSSAEFLSHVSDRHPDGALYCRTRAELPEGENVLMEISFPGLPNRALLRGRVLEAGDGKGAWLAFDPADASTRAFLLRLARGEIEVTEKIERSYDRFPAEVPVDCRVDTDPTNGEHVVSRTLDLGAGGVFVRSDVSPPIGTRVQLVIGPLGDDPSETFTVEGEVARVHGTDDAAGFAVRFDNKTGDTSRLRNLLRRASESGRVRLKGDQ
jgi:Tfp pilus assembly protein PilZ